MSQRKHQTESEERQLCWHCVLPADHELEAADPHRNNILLLGELLGINLFEQTPHYLNIFSYLKKYSSYIDYYFIFIRFFVTKK